MYTKEEKAELERLYKLYYEKDNEYEKAKGKRTWLTVLGFTVFYLIVFYAISKKIIEPRFTNEGEALLLLAVLSVISFITSWIHYFVNAAIFGYISQKGRKEYEELQNIKRKVNAIKDEPPMGFWYPDDDF